MLRSEAEPAQTMAVKPAMVAKAVSREDEDHLFPAGLWGEVERRRESIIGFTEPLDSHP